MVLRTPEKVVKQRSMMGKMLAHWWVVSRRKKWSPLLLVVEVGLVMFLR